MTTCPSCGRELPDGAKFCGGCGALISEVSAPGTGYTPPAAPGYAAPSTGYTPPTAPGYGAPAGTGYVPPTAPGYAAPSPSGYTPPASGYAAPGYAPTAASPYGAPPSPYAPPPRYKAPGGYDAGTGADGGRPTKSIIGMSLSIAGLLCAITSMTLIFTWLSVRTLYSGAANVVWTFVLAGLGLALGIAGTIVSSKGRRNAAGRGMGTAGKIMGIISIVVSALVLVAAIIIVAIVVQYRW